MAGYDAGKLKEMTDSEICRAVMKKNGKRKEVIRALQSLVREGRLILTPSGYYTTKKAAKPFRAVVRGNKKGFAFLTATDEDSVRNGDLHVYEKDLLGAYDGDIVLAARDKSGEGYVLEIIERGNKRICGTLYATAPHALVSPDNDKFASDVVIDAGHLLGASRGQKVVVQITSYDEKNTPHGVVEEILGKPGDFLVEELAVIRSFSLYEEFSEKAEKEALASSRREITPGEGRQDLRDVYTITIDGTDTRDMDDAISLEKTDEGFTLGVHIADVTEYVAFGSGLDEEAYERGTSVYFPDRVFPMLPQSLSNGACSLNEGEDRYALSCVIKYSPEGKVISTQIYESVIRSDRRLSYPDANGILDGDEELLERMPDAAGPLRDMLELRNILRGKREKKGAVDLDVKEAKIYFEDGKIDIPEFERGVSEDIIEQFMIAANEAVAEFAQKNRLPILYRVHEAPTGDKVDQLSSFLHDLGVRMKFNREDIRPKDYAAVLKDTEDHPAAAVINTVMLRSMQKARYCEKNLGHFGLASSCYCHFTSPIRRYPDLFTHRTIKAFLHGEKNRINKFASLTEDAGEETSERERVADACERAVDNLYMCAYMQGHIGEDYEAVISGVTSFGIFAQLKNTVEGQIRIEELPYDSYVFDEARLSLIGKKHRFTIGDNVHIIVKDTSMSQRKIFFSLYEMMQY